MVSATIESGTGSMRQQERIVKLETELEYLRTVAQHDRIVEQATGAISVRYRISPSDASEMLFEGATSQRRNVHELASAVIANGGSFAGA
jgi:AmiR/NasT family two-component response regulator